jgi:prophage DNA circulation protein
MSEWRDNLREARYRGVSFFVQGSELTTGRRALTHVFPQRDTPYVEDLGRKPQSFKIEGFLIGDRYMRSRDRMITVCGAPGIRYPFEPGGLLVHPYLGQKNVVCTNLLVKESASEGGMCRLTMTFQETSERQKPSAVESQGVRRSEAAEAAATDQAAGELDSGLLVTGETQSVYDAAFDQLDALGDAMDSLDVFSGPLKDIAAFQDKVTSFIAEAAALATAPANLIAGVRGAFDSIKSAVGNALAALSAYELLFGFDNSIPSPAGTGPAAQAAADNAALIAKLVKTAAIGGATTSAIDAEFESRQDAEAARERIVAMLDELEPVVSDALYLELRTIRQIASTAIPAANRNLPDIETLVLPGTVPALVLAYRLYDDRKRDAEIVARNQDLIEHPGFVPGGQALEVLSA